MVHLYTKLFPENFDIFKEKFISNDKICHKLIHNKGLHLIPYSYLTEDMWKEVIYAYGYKSIPNDYLTDNLLLYALGCTSGIINIFSDENIF